MAPPARPGDARSKLLAQVRERVLELNQGSAPERINRFSAEIRRGAEALPQLLMVLEDPDQQARLDALVAIGRVFTAGGVEKSAIDALLAHSRRIREKGLGPERHATLYALGRSQAPGLIDGFVALLKAEEPQTVNVASYLLGYARWEPAVPFLKFIATRNFAPTAGPATWALGQIGSADGLEAVLLLATHGKHLEESLPALGRIGAPAGLEVLASVLSSKIPRHRHLAAHAITSVLAAGADRKTLGWLLPTLRAAARDDFGPVAAHAVIALALLGEKVEEATLRAALALEKEGLFTAEESFRLTRGPRPPS